MTNPTPDDSLIWQVRHFVFQRLAQTGHPPTPTEAAQALNLTLAQAQELYQTLHQRHAFLLNEGTFDVRLANPFSGIPTDFNVQSGGIHYYANCAWDSLGIPVALHADAQIDSHCTFSGDPIHLQVQQGQVIGDTHVLVHFAVPFAHWYDDLIHT